MHFLTNRFKILHNASELSKFLQFIEYMSVCNVNVTGFNIINEKDADIIFDFHFIHHEICFYCFTLDVFIIIP